jgi:hypothetical protein
MEMIRYKTQITNLIAFLLVLLRYLVYIYKPSFSLDNNWFIGLVFLLIAVGWIARRSHLYTHLYPIIQTCILLAVKLLTRIENFGQLDRQPLDGYTCCH